MSAVDDQYRRIRDLGQRFLALSNDFETDRAYLAEQFSQFADQLEIIIERYFPHDAE